MTGYRPKHPIHRLLFELSGIEGRFGHSVRRKLMRRLGKYSLADFDRRLAMLTSQDICLDLGANMGVYTEKLAATGAEVHAYEPDPHCFAALQTRFADRANVHLHNQAVSGEAGQFILRRTRDFAQNPDLRSQSSSIAVNDPLQYDPQTGFKVETLAFVDVVSHFARPIALIKMDIEGAEFSILTQLFADMDRTRALPIGALFVETHERHFPQHVALVKSLREMNWDGALPFPIDAFWP